MPKETKPLHWLRVANKPHLRIHLSYGGKEIRFGHIDMKPDNSLVFTSSMINDTKRYPFLDFGKFGKEVEKRSKNSGDIHATFHPSGIIHMKRQGTNEKLFEKQIDWFPVNKSLCILRLTTPPLDECVLTPKRGDCPIMISDDYKDSLDFHVFIFPYDEVRIPKIQGSEEAVILGRKENFYNISVCYSFAQKRYKPAILFPDTPEFKYANTNYLGDYKN